MTGPAPAAGGRPAQAAPKGPPASAGPVLAPLEDLPGIGPRLQPLIEKVAGPRIADLLFLVPHSAIDRRQRSTVAGAPLGEIVTLEVTVLQHRAGNRRPYRVSAIDSSGPLTLVFFNGRKDFLEKALPVGQVRLISGRIEEYDGARQMAHPDYVVDPADPGALPPIEPVYPLTAGLTGKVLVKLMRRALDRLPEQPEWLDAAWKDGHDWPGFKSALTALHRPETPGSLDPSHPARQRLAYDEFLASQLALALIRNHQRHSGGQPLIGTGALNAKILRGLPYRLTGAQTRSLTEIREDMAAHTRMVRLLQGDVGAGKTVVALLAMATAVEAGTQAALMAPTELLAQQHYGEIGPLCAEHGLRAALLTGRLKPAERREVTEALAGGAIDIVIGTHALVQDKVAFKNLGLVVVDEQHRFGVAQRMALTGKGRAPDLLVMTATPIPRTLALTAYGDMDVSRLDEKPPGRQPVTTRAVPVTRLEDVTIRIKAAVESGQRAYWVCPLVEDTETSELAAAETRYRVLAQRLGERVGLVHGRMAAGDRDEVMEAFAAGRISVLVATTVIEVGVNVPEATIMVVEHAERFGLAQLHQLRGRVGRGTGASTCLLLFKPPLGAIARQRLDTLRRTEDGFVIAEEDLRLRGAGDALGTKQSGDPAFRFGEPSRDKELLLAARDDARLVLNKDPALASPRGQALRALLYLFGRNEAVRLLKAG